VDGREVGVAEVLGDEACVAGRLAKPGRGSVAEGMGGDALLDARSPGGSRDDPGEDRRLQAAAAEAAKDRRVRVRLITRAPAGELVRERWRERLAPRLAALARANENGGLGAVEVDVAPVERD
jgi:hypothetical protein